MLFRSLRMTCALLLAVSAVPQNLPDSATRTREYAQFLVQQLDQWTRDFPQAYNMALVRPPVDTAGLSEGAKGGAQMLRESVVHLAVLSSARDLTVNAEFLKQLGKTIAAASPVNEALSKQKFPEAVQGDWSSIRTSLNSLADICQAGRLPVLAEAFTNDKAGPKAAAALPAGALTAYVVDQTCAARGKGMWLNTQCVQKCLRDGDKAVLVTEQGKVFQIANQEKIEAESYGQKVAVTGKTEGDTITVATLQIL